MPSSGQIIKPDMKHTGLQYSRVLTPNEVRALEEMELKKWRQVLINGNMMPIEMAGEQYRKNNNEPENTGDQKGGESSEKQG